MEVVGAAFRNHFHLRPGVATVLGRVGVRSDIDFLDRLSVGCYDGGATPLQTVDADPVQCEIVCRNPLPVGDRLDLVFGLENLVV